MTGQDVAALLAQAFDLLRVDDPVQTPYKSKYEAAELCKECHRICIAAARTPTEELAAALVLCQSGLILMYTDLGSEGKALLMKGIPVVEGSGRFFPAFLQVHCGPARHVCR